MRPALLVFATSMLLAGCFSRSADTLGLPAPEWRIGDRWSWSVQSDWESWTTTETVLDRTTVGGKPVYEVSIDTTLSSMVPSRTIYVSQVTLNHVAVACDDPGERKPCIFEERELDFPLRNNETWTFATGGGTPLSYDARVTAAENGTWRFDYKYEVGDCPDQCFFQVYDPVIRHLTYRESGARTILGNSSTVWRLVEHPP